MKATYINRGRTTKLSPAAALQLANEHNHLQLCILLGAHLDRCRKCIFCARRYCPDGKRLRMMLGRTMRKIA